MGSDESTMMASNASSVSATYFSPSAMTISVRGSSNAVDLDQHGALHARVAQHLTQNAAVAAADDEHALRLVEGHERHVRHHLMIDKLVGRRQLAHPVEHEDGAPRLVLEDDEVLVVGLDLVQHLGGLQGDAPVRVKRLFDPALAHRMVLIGSFDRRTGASQHDSVMKHVADDAQARRRRAPTAMKTRARAALAGRVEKSRRPVTAKGSRRGGAPRGTPRTHPSPGPSPMGQAQIRRIRPPFSRTP
jgi:hypothetical protein